nr:helicase-related protein [cf. Phormidesmis sp. LEGE 11477]
MGDSQAVKNTCNASVGSKGFCFYKATNGIKRHLAVDTLGFPFFTLCTPANVSDDAGLIEMLIRNIDYFRAKPVNIPKITILLDNGYHPDKLSEALESVYPNVMNKIRFELAHFITILRQELATRESAIAFTQYTDTMDFLRETVRQLYGAQVACYSGRGGEMWRDGRWTVVSKEKIKKRFKKGKIKILLCTESASEGLNLQTCGVLINYDMPWNPMRVEQRIGRIDRIGQTYSVRRQ